MDSPNPIQPTYRVYAAAIIILAFFLVAAFLIYRIFGPGTTDGQWTQALVVFNGVSTLATTAAGVLLGVEVQQGNVQAANRHAADAQAEAEKKGQKLATQRETMIRALATVEHGAASEAMRGAESLAAGDGGAAEAARILRDGLVANP